MVLRRVLVTGPPGFLQRYRYLFEALSAHFESVELLPSRPYSLWRRAVFKGRSMLNERVNRRVIGVLDGMFVTHPSDARFFASRSRQMERRIAALTQRPDVVLDVFAMCSPFWDEVTVPYTLILDYTMALARRHYPPWAPFATERQYRKFIDCERRTYAKAEHLFTFGSQTQESLVVDYGIAPERTSVVGSSGHFLHPYVGQRMFGSQRILFNASEFHRKGGDRVLGAFRIVREAIPGARLTVIGEPLGITEPGVDNPGFVASPEEMERLFLSTDLVVAPARCDPYPGFLIEALSYGVPCITSAVDGMPDIVEHGKCGLVLENCEPPVLAQAILSLLKEPQRLSAMSDQARRRVRERFTWPLIAKKMSETLLREGASWERRA
jgi:glycosyltransferase involved in cell wall biosynthesis